MFIAIIWCLRGFLSYKQVVHNSCNMGTRGLSDIYTLSPRACGPRALDVYIRQTTCAYVTNIIIIYIYYIKLKSCLSVRPSVRLSVTSVSRHFCMDRHEVYSK